MHRDIKPENILMNSRGEVKLTDFGISRQLEQSAQKMDTFVGTLKYMSPERLEGEKYTFAGDIWSLGLIIIEMLTGHFPYSEKGTKEFWSLLEEISRLPAPNVPENDPRFSEEVFDFLRCCMQKNSYERESALSLLAHPWILKNSGSGESMPKFARDIKRFRQKKKQK